MYASRSQPKMTMTQAPEEATRRRRRRPAPPAPQPGGRRIQVRRSGVHGKGMFAVAPLAKGDEVIEYTGEVITWREALRRHPHDPNDPDHTFYFHIDDKHVIDAKFGGNSARWINHACTPELRGRRGRRPRLHQGAARHRARRGAVLRLRPRHRRALHREAEEAVRMPLRHAGLPRHDARAQAMSPGRPEPCPRAPPALGRAGAVEAARAACCRASASRCWRVRRRPTANCSSGRASSRRRARAGSATRADLAQRVGRRQADTQPCLLVAEHQMAGRGRLGRGWRSAPRRLADLLARAAAGAARLVGPVAGGRRGAGRGAAARPASSRRAARPEVAQRPVAGRPVGADAPRRGLPAGASWAAC